MINFDSLKKKDFFFLICLKYQWTHVNFGLKQKRQQILVEDRRCNAVVHALPFISVDAAVAAATNRFFTLNKHLKSPQGFS